MVHHHCTRVYVDCPKLLDREREYMTRHIIQTLQHSKKNHSLTTRQSEFQVCCIDKVDLTGVRLSRVKGDTWAYKKETDALLDKMRL